MIKNNKRLFFKRIHVFIVGVLVLSMVLPLSGIARAQVADADVIALSGGNATLDLSVSTEANVFIDDGLTVNYDGPLNMSVTIEVT